ncbi:hypothetical protein GCM10023349_07710 [Nocardioides conyzicola]|uniref:N-acetyltransferase domain-containing protein n=2 Tax=Nocardioides conyzicola TaxID=1651781 RepID=A0ABP8WV41_9ACTN
MPITMKRGTVDSLDEVVLAMGPWQDDEGSVQLHPGDLGWNWSLGTQELADALRVWRRDEEIVAVGMVDDAGLIRLAVAPSVDGDEAFARRLLADLAGIGIVETRRGAALRELLTGSGWVDDERWTPLRRDLTAPVEDVGLRVEVVDDHNVRDRVEVHRAMFPGSAFTLERWQTMAAASPYRQARCLVGYGPDGVAVATVTVWSAGEGRAGLIEPLGVHREHRGHGYGTAITRAAAAALREMGSSSATVCTPSSNVGGVAAYVSAGFQQLPDVADLRRPS